MFVAYFEILSAIGGIEKVCPLGATDDFMKLLDAIEERKRLGHPCEVKVYTAELGQLKLNACPDFTATLTDCHWRYSWRNITIRREVERRRGFNYPPSFEPHEE